MHYSKGILFIMVLVFAGACSAGEWYEGGTLTDKGALEWQKATLANKIASSADFVAAMYQKHLFNTTVTSKISNINDLAPYAINLAICLDGATKKKVDPEKNKMIYTNQTISGMAAICVMMMGWTNK